MVDWRNGSRSRMGDMQTGRKDKYPKDFSFVFWLGMAPATSQERVTTLPWCLARVTLMVFAECVICRVILERLALSVKLMVTVGSFNVCKTVAKVKE